MRRTISGSSLAIVLLSSCLPVTSPTEHLRLDVDVDRTELSVGSPVSIRVRLSNAAVTGARTATLHGSSDCTFGFRVRDAQGQVVAPTQRACTNDVRQWYVEPGQQIVQTFIWSGTAGPGSVEGVPPGPYTLVGVLESSEIRLESSPVALQVRGPH
jgi:hypothetical protein